MYQEEIYLRLEGVNLGQSGTMKMVKNIHGDVARMTLSHWACTEGIRKNGKVNILHSHNHHCSAKINPNTHCAQVVSEQLLFWRASYIGGIFTETGYSSRERKESLGACFFLPGCWSVFWTQTKVQLFHGGLMEAINFWPMQEVFCHVDLLWFILPGLSPEVINQVVCQP